MKTCVVIPTIRSLAFLHEWKNQFKDCHLIIIEDHPTVQIDVPEISCLGVKQYAWNDIQQDFGKDEWIFSRRNAGIRSYGFWKAYEDGADFIVTLDDDCFPVADGFITQHLDNLSTSAPDGWTPTYPDPAYMFTRGFPYQARNKHHVLISHGLWTNKIDLDGITEQHHPSLNQPIYPPLRQFIPQGSYFPMCSMNLAFRRDVTPLMYFPLMGYDPDGKHWGYDRFDDIWAGIFAKKICDHLGLSVTNGSPFVEHRKASDVKANIKKETPGIKTNENLWLAVQRVRLNSRTIADCYLELAATVKFPAEQYFHYLRKAMRLWGNLYHK
jgi:hypothetical protein